MYELNGVKPEEEDDEFIPEVLASKACQCGGSSGRFDSAPRLGVGDLRGFPPDPRRGCSPGYELAARVGKIGKSKKRKKAAL